MQQKLKKHLFLTSIFLLCIFGIFAFILTSNAGLNCIVYVIGKVSGDEFTTENVKGNLLGSVHIDKLHYKNSEFDLKANDVFLTWDLSALFANKLHVKKLYIANTSIMLNSTVSSPYKKTDFEHKNKEQTFVNELREDFSAISANHQLPIKIVLDDVKLNNISLQQKNSRPILIDYINLAANIATIESWHLTVAIKAKNSEAEFFGDLDKVWRVKWNCKVPDLQNLIAEVSGKFTSNGSITGALQTPKIVANSIVQGLKYANNSLQQIESNISINLAAADASRFDLNALKIKWRGFSLDRFTLQSFIRKDSTNQIKVNLAIPSFAISTPYSNQLKQIKLQAIDGNLLLNDKGFSSDFVVTLSAKLPILHLQFTLPDYKIFSIPDGSVKVSGKLSFTTDKLNFLAEISPQLKNLSGGLFANVDFSGTIENPKYTGKILLSNINFLIPKGNLLLSHCSAEINVINNLINYSAKLNSGTGSLQINGKADLTQKAITNTANIFGNNFLAVNLPEYKIAISPDLQLKFQNNAFYLAGKIIIPNANIKPTKFNNVVTLPAETVFTANKTQSISLEKLPLYSDVTVILGDDVNIDAMDIKGKMIGQVEVVDEPSRVTIGRGLLSIKNGTYNLYKEKLEITEGALKFAGDDIKNPMLTLRSIRKFKASNAEQQDFYVGILTRGKLDNLTTTLFSVPSTLSQTDIFSYLVLGIPSSQASQDKAQLLMKAASFLNFRGTGPVSGLVEGIRKQFGLSELELGSETLFTKPTVITAGGRSYISNSSDMMTNTALVLGKYISPRLYVGYSVGLLDSISIFRIRYFLTKSWSVQSESSTTGNGADVLYTVERD